MLCDKTFGGRWLSRILWHILSSIGPRYVCMLEKTCVAIARTPLFSGALDLALLLVLRIGYTNNINNINGMCFLVCPNDMCWYLLACVLMRHSSY